MSIPSIGIGHIVPGAAIFAVGLWQLFSHIKLFSLRPDAYVAPVWFPAPGIRHLELFFVILGSTAQIMVEIVIGHATLLPIDADGSIPSGRLHNLEHSLFCLALVVYAAVAIHLDRLRARGRDTLCLLLIAVAFAQELLLFHFHSTDLAGLEGHFHWLLQIVIASCLGSALLGVALPRSFAVSFVRSASIAFQGIWLMVIGATLWTPSLVPKGCAAVHEDGRDTVRCHTAAALQRAKALVNLQFGWYMTATSVLVVALYLFVCKMYPMETAYAPLAKAGDEEGDMEAHKGALGHVDMHGGFAPLELEM